MLSPALPGARHDVGAAPEHGLIDALATADIRVIADSAYRAAGANVEVPQRRRARENDFDERPRPSANQQAVNSAHTRYAAPANEPTPSSQAGKSCVASEPARTTQPG